MPTLTTPTTFSPSEIHSSSASKAGGVGCTTKRMLGGFLRGIHFYRKVPHDLTEATLTGGTISLASSLIMAYLFITKCELSPLDSPPLPSPPPPSRWTPSPYPR